LRRRLRQVAPPVAVAMGLLMLGPTEVSAQHHGHSHGYRFYVGYGYPYFYPAFYYSAWYGPWGWYGYPWGPWPGYAYYDNSSSVRIQGAPREAEVYVDGYYAGVVDDFDGIFQRLYVAPGRHVITVKMEGYRTHNFKVFVPYDGTVKIHHQMVAGTGEDTEEMARTAEESYYEERRREEEDERQSHDDARAHGDEEEARDGVREREVRGVGVASRDDGAGRVQALRLGVHALRVAVRPAQRHDDREVAAPGLERTAERGRKLRSRICRRGGAKHDVEQHHGGGGVATFPRDPVAADVAVDHRVRPADRELVGAEVGDAMSCALAGERRRHVGELRVQQRNGLLREGAAGVHAADEALRRIEPPGG